MRSLLIFLMLAYTLGTLGQNNYFRSQIVRSATVQIGSTQTVKIGKNVQIGGGVKGERWYLSTLNADPLTQSFALKENKNTLYVLVFDEHQVLQITPQKDTCQSIKSENMYNYHLSGDTIQINVPKTGCSIDALSNRKYVIQEYKKGKMVWRRL